MSIISVNGKQVEVDIRAELEQYDWHRAKWSQEKLQAASPFRYDHTPSFYIYLEDTATAKAGYFGDSGTGERGGFVKLLAFLRNEDEQSTVEYLLETYASINEGDVPSLNIPKLKVNRFRQLINEQILENYKYASTYLTNRGVAPSVQTLYGAGFDTKTNAVTIPWRTTNGKLATIKYRKTDSKSFWYHSEGMPVRTLVFGIDLVYSRMAKTVVLCEAEVDAMTAASADDSLVALAVGGSSFSDEQAEVIKRSPIERLIIASDRDKAGDKLKQQVIDKLGDYIALYEVVIPEPYKDINEVNDVEAVKSILKDAKRVNSVQAKIKKIAR